MALCMIEVGYAGSTCFVQLRAQRFPEQTYAVERLDQTLWLKSGSCIFWVLFDIPGFEMRAKGVCLARSF